MDEDGNLCPLADNRVEFLVEGQGSYLASDAGDPTSLRRFQEPYCDVFHGKAVAALCSGTEPGYILVKAESPGLQSGFLILSVEK